MFTEKPGAIVMVSVLHALSPNSPGPFGASANAWKSIVPAFTVGAMPRHTARRNAAVRNLCIGPPLAFLLPKPSGMNASPDAQANVKKDR